MAKKKVVCDTDVIIEYFDNKKAKHHSTIDIIENIIGLDNVILTAITQMELLVGAINKIDYVKINKKLQRFDSLLLNDKITLKAFELLEKYSLSHNLEIPDCLIASTAIITNLELFTYNLKDFKFIEELKLYKI